MRLSADIAGSWLSARARASSDGSVGGAPEAFDETEEIKPTLPNQMIERLVSQLIAATSS
jgi:hypothetical protein